MIKPSKNNKNEKPPKNRQYNITNKIYNLLKDGDVNIILKRKRWNFYGEYKPESETIEIDFRRDIIPTFIHECLHKWHPTWCETRVVKEEIHIINSITAKQVKNIIKMLATYL